MSPDPPREDSGDDENRIRRFSGEFMEGMINDDEFFIVPDAPYELDMEEESEYTDSDGEGTSNGAGATARNPNRTSHSEAMLQVGEPENLFQEGQGRGRYRLLIPFPTSSNTSEVTDNASYSRNDTVEARLESTSASTNCNKSDEAADTSASNEKASVASSSQNPLPDDLCAKNHSMGEDTENREIELSDEKVEKIKEVMKNITLPSTSFPPWAREIDEESWKKKLNESIVSSNGQCGTSDKTPSE